MVIVMPRFKRGIQYAVSDFVSEHIRPELLDRPLSRAMTAV
jgi:hypothetical protein